MKRFFYLLPFILFSTSLLKGQSVTVSGECITGNITLNSIGNVDGKPAYESRGTVQGYSNVQVDVYWLTPENLWVLAFDGQPYFQNSCNTAMPPATGSTTCSWNTVPGQTCTGGSALSITGTGTLPVKIISFAAQANKNEINLYWKTATEVNNKGFEIQRSADGIGWTDIGFVNGSMNTSTEKNYQFVDASPIAGKSFYRLLQIDLDNGTAYSSVVSVTFLQSGFYYVTNNPGNGLYKLHIEATGNDKISFSVIDFNGRRIMNENSGNTGDRTIDLTNYSPGIYLLQIQRGNNLFTEKLIKL